MAVQPGDQPPTFSHVNVTYRSEDDLARRVADEVHQALDCGHEVLVCIPQRHWDQACRRLGDATRRVTYMSADDRYVRPVEAMASLSEFVTHSLDVGAEAVRSIGRIDYRGQPSDGEWLRYEAAVNEVFAAVPLRAVCLTDATLAEDTVRDLERVHPSWDDGTGERRSTSFDPEEVCRCLPRTVSPPARQPDLEHAGEDLAALRRRVRHTVGQALDPALFQDVLLVVTELLANTRKHADGTGSLGLWLEPDAVVVSTSDAGPGIVDHCYGLRPPQLGAGGRGLWLINHLADGLASSTADGVHTVTVRLARPH